MAAIRKMLDLSTSHLPQYLGYDGLAGAPGVIAHATTYGWLMWVPDDPDESAKGSDEPVPVEVLAIQRYARLHDCDYVLFDADGHDDDNLPRWNW